MTTNIEVAQLIPINANIVPASNNGIVERIPLVVDQNITMHDGIDSYYPFKNRMSVGDSVKIAGEKSYRRAKNAAYRIGRKYGMKFRARREKPSGGRIWRIS